jgi:hypothetical protein
MFKTRSGDNDRLVDRLEAVTGRWPSLLQSLLNLAGENRTNLADYIEALDQRLGDHDFARDIAQSFGFTTSGQVHLRTLRAVAELGPGPISPADLDTNRDLVPNLLRDVDSRTLVRSFQWARLLGFMVPATRGSDDRGVSNSAPSKGSGTEDRWLLDPVISRILQVGWPDEDLED